MLRGQLRCRQRKGETRMDLSRSLAEHHCMERLSLKKEFMILSATCAAPCYQAVETPHYTIPLLFHCHLLDCFEGSLPLSVFGVTRMRYVS